MDSLLDCKFHEQKAYVLSNMLSLQPLSLRKRAHNVVFAGCGMRPFLRL